VTKAVKRNEYADDAVLPTDPAELLADLGLEESAFLPGQYAATKAKLKELLDENIDPDIAARQAVSLCAPGLAKKHFKADGLGQVPTRAKIGGNYTAVDHGNGFFSIVNIPIFAEVPPGAKRNKERIGEEWMDKALEKNRMRRKEGHLPPVHIYHSDEHAVKPEYAGKFVITKRGTITYEGDEIPALFASVIDIPAAVFERIKDGMLPYRSVEVHDWDNPEIDSLALMPTDVPFFRMAMTTIGDVKKGDHPIGFKHTSEHPTPIHWYAPQDAGALVCFRFDDRKGANMAFTTKSGDTSKGLSKSPAASGGSGKTSEGLTGQEDGTGGEIGPSSGTNTEDQEAIGLDDAPGGTEDVEVKMDDSMGGAPPAGGDPMSAIMQLLQQIAQKLGCGGGAPPAPPPEAPTQDLAPVSGMSAGGSNRLRAAEVERIILKAVLPLQSQVANLTAQNKKAVANSQFRAMVEKAFKQLDGWTIDDEVQASLLKAARYGQEMLDEAVKLVQMTNPVNPPTDPAAFEAMMAETPGGDEVSAFASAHPGTKNQEWIRAQSKSWQDYVSATGSGITLKSWLETNMRHESVTMRG
jgi:hypothetical protein